MNPSSDGAPLAERRSLMRLIVAGSLRFRFLIVAAAVALMVIGTAATSSARVDVFPEFAPPQVEIQTICVGLSTTDVEQLVTVPIEQVLGGISGLDDLRSKSVPQLSSIQLIFNVGTDLLKARQLVAERLAIVSPTLPTWASPPVMMPPVSATSRVMQIGMSSKKQSQIEMSMEAYWTIRARILQVPGVANVAMWGEHLRMMTVQIDPTRMASQQVSLESLMDATSDSVDSGLLKFSNASIIGAGGYVDTSNQRLGINDILPIVTPGDLAKVTVPNADKKNVPIGDVASVVETSQPLVGDAIINDGPGLLLVVEKLPWGNTLDITRGVKEALNELQPGLPDVTFDPTIFQQTDFIDISIHNLAEALLLGFLLVVVILALFLYEWRVALISLLTIPLALTATLLVLRETNTTINTMTLAGLVIALGAVVDDAIIDVENILRRLRAHRRDGSGVDGQSVARVILSASIEVRGPIVYATLIIVAAAVPVFLLQGLTGSFFRPLAISYTLAIFASMLVALTVTPALAFILLRRARVERRESPIVRWLQRRYERSLSKIVRRPRRAYAGFGVLAIAAIVVLPTLGQELFPTFKERSFLIHWITAPGTSVQEEDRIIASLSRDLRAIPGVRDDFGSHIGQAFLGEEVQGVNFGECWLSIKPDADYTATLDAVEEAVAKYPGIYHDVTTYLNERIEEVLTGAKEPIVVRIYGDDMSVIRAKSLELQHKLGAIEGTADVHADLQVDEAQVQVEVDLNTAAKYGLKPGDVRRAAATLVAGEEVGDIFRDGKAYDTVVWSTPATRANVASISALPIDTPSGDRIKLGDVAKIEINAVPNVIERENASRKIDVAAAVKGRDLGSVIGDVQKAVASMDFPRGYHAQILGEYKERQAAQGNLFRTALIAAVAILILLQISFRSWRLATLSFLTLPMALVGGVLAAWLSSGVVSLGALVGFFTVFGIAARNGILLINHCQHLQEYEGETFGADLVLRGAKERLSPILMTTLATGLAVLPLVILGDRPGDEIEHPLAIVLLGGLVTSTLLNLFVVPSLYLRFGQKRRVAA